MSSGQFFQTQVKWCTELILREAVQLDCLRDFVRLAADNDRY